MYTTSATFLDRLRDPHDAPAWQLWLRLYTPLLHRWLAHARLHADDQDDVVQEVLVVVAQKLPEFEPRKPGAFRSWLKAVTHNKLRDHLRCRRRHSLHLTQCEQTDLLAQLEDPGSNLNQEWDFQHDHYMVHRLLELIRPEFSTTTWQAFRLVVLENQSTNNAAQQLGLTPNAVMIAKSRVLARLRRELQFFIDS